MKFRESTPLVSTPDQPPVAPSPYRDNVSLLFDAVIASIALAVITGLVCIFIGAEAKLVLLAALVPWGLLAIGRLIVLMTVIVEELLMLAGHPRDLNQDGRMGLRRIEVVSEDGKPVKLG